MEIFDAVKFKMLFNEVKEPEEFGDVKMLGIEMATTGKVEELLKKPFAELMDALHSLNDRIVDAEKLSEHLQRIDSGVKAAVKIAGPRRMW